MKQIVYKSTDRYGGHKEMRRIKAFSIVLACVITLGSFSACAKSSAGPETEVDDRNIGVVETSAAEEEREQILCGSLGNFMALKSVFSQTVHPVFEGYFDTDADYIPCIENNGYIYLQNRVGGSQYDYNYYDSVEIIDEDTMSIIKEIPIGDPSYVTKIKFFVLGGKAYVIEFDSDNSVAAVFSFDENFDLVFEEDLKELISGELSVPENTDSAGTYLTNIYSYQNGAVFSISQIDYWGEILFNELVFIEDSGDVHYVQIPNFKTSGDSLISGFSYGNDYYAVKSVYEYFVVDINSYTTANVQIPYDVLASHNITTGEDGNYLVNTLEGFYEVNPDTKEVYELIDYNTVLGNTTVLYDSHFLFEKDGEYWFSCTLFPEGYNRFTDKFDMDSRIFKVTPCENPYPDKVVVNLASSVSDIDMIRTLKDYNSSDGAYYVTYRLLDGSTPSYDSLIQNTDARYYYADDPESYIKYYYSLAMSEKAKLEILKKSNDIDIAYGFGLNSAFDNGGLMADLSGFVDADDTIDDDTFFMNLIEAKKDSSGSLYTMPLAVEINAFSAPDYSSYGLSYKDYTNSEGGITFDDYNDLVYKNSISFDPVCFSSRPYETLPELISNEPDKFYDLSTGEPVFDKAEFLRLVEFVEAHSTEYLAVNGDYSVDDVIVFDYTNCKSILDLFFMSYDPDTDQNSPVFVNYYGLPSSDGRGLSADMTSCVSILNSSCEKDGAWDFIRFLMGNMAVNTYNGDGFMVNRSLNRKVQTSLLANFFSYYYYESNFTADNDKVLDNMSSTLENVDRFRSRDDIMIYTYISFYVKYYQGSLTRDDLALNVEKALNETSSGIYDNLNQS